MLEDVDQQQHVQAVLERWGLCAEVDVVRTCCLMFLQLRRGLGHCRFQKKELIQKYKLKKHNERNRMKCRSLEIMSPIGVKNEEIDWTNSNRAQLQCFHDGIQRVKTAQTD
jgi:hypothetical protein